jgi:hypothetical protein
MSSLAKTMAHAYSGRTPFTTMLLCHYFILKPNGDLNGINRISSIETEYLQIKYTMPIGNEQIWNTFALIPFSRLCPA